MIIKGASRAEPAWLARHLQRLDANERIEILELQSPVEDLHTTFRDWQMLSEATRGKKGLYHANIDPAQNYAMSRAQWDRAVDLLESELGFQGQPRAVVLHEKHGRQHIHVVWARTDIQTMTLRSDSMNYVAHERASKKLEEEFGHDRVPGKHAKRDRKKQPNFPRAAADQAEWQQGERTGLDPAARKARIAALKASSDCGRTFKSALEGDGYILAQGDRRDFVIVDGTGAIHSLGRQVQSVMTAKELRNFMKDVDRETLPIATEAVGLQRQSRNEQPLALEVPKPASEAEAKPLRLDAHWEESERLRKAFLDRQMRERQQLLESQDRQLAHYRDVLNRETGEAIDRFDARQKTQAEARAQDLKDAEPSGLAAVGRRFQDLIHPAGAAKREAEQHLAQQEFELRQDRARNDYISLLRNENDKAIKNLAEAQAKRVAAESAQRKEEFDRYMRELERTRQLRAEEEARERQREEERAKQLQEKPPPRAR